MDARAEAKATIDYDDAPFGLFHMRVAIASCGGVFSDGYGLGIIGISLSHAPPHLGLTPLWMGLLGGASLLGLFAGALLTGPAADRFGPRRARPGGLALDAYHECGALSLGIAAQSHHAGVASMVDQSRPYPRSRPHRTRQARRRRGGADACGGPAVG